MRRHRNPATIVAVKAVQQCPCGSAVNYGDCCEPLHRGDAKARTAEQLMRSRYSAFAMGEAGYLAATWADATRPVEIRLVPDQKWIGLTILDTSRGALLDHDGEVEFVARYRRRGVEGELHERSRFTRQLGSWVYVGPATG